MILNTHDLAIGYGKGKSRLVVGSDINLTMPPGRTVCLLGPNGCGKTTLIRTLLGLIRPLSGEVRLDNASISAMTRRDIARRIAYVPQSHTPPFAFSVTDIVMMGRSAHLARFAQPASTDYRASDRALSEVGIRSLAQTSYADLSGGQRQLVLIARALAQESNIIIMDEPAASLDFGNQGRLLSHIARLTKQSGRSVVMSTHNPDHALMLQAHVVVMKGGAVLAQGSAQQTLSGDLLSHVYDTTVRVEQTSRGSVVCYAVGPGPASDESSPSADKSSSR